MLSSLWAALRGKAPSPSQSHMSSHVLLQSLERINGARYTVHRLLGVGRHSSIFLVEDEQRSATWVTPQYIPPTHTISRYSTISRYYAVKILTAEATAMHRRGISRELEFLEAIRDKQRSPQLPILRDSFEHISPRGTHLCFVTDVTCIELATFRRTAPRKVLPAFTVKTIIGQVADALSRLHRLGIIHTGP